MSKQISFIHTADLHLDSPFHGLTNIPEPIFKEIRESTFRALDHMVEEAIHKKVDFVLIVGDLFDNDKQSLKAQIRLRRAFEKLAVHKITVYLSYGNHDHMKGNIHPVTYPDNVHMFTSENVSQFTFEKDGQPLAEIHGFSYENRAVTENKTADYKIMHQDIPFHIAMLHGSLLSNTSHDTYAPFQMSDLIKKDFDYWALGHIHQREILRKEPLIIYPGNTQGRHRNETGEKGCYHVVLSETETSLNFIPLQALQFNSITIDVSNCDEIHQLEEQVMLRLKQRETTTPELIDLTLKSQQSNLRKWKNHYDIEDMIELVNESFLAETNWQYIFRSKIEINQEYDSSVYEGDYFISELVTQLENKSIQPHIKDLFRHRQGRKYLEMLTKEQEKSIKEEAKQLLLNELLSSRGD